MVSRLVRDQEIAGSIPVTPTMDKDKLYTGGPLVDDLLARVEQLEKDKAKLEKTVERLSRQLESLMTAVSFHGISVY